MTYGQQSIIIATSDSLDSLDCLTTRRSAGAKKNNDGSRDECFANAKPANQTNGQGFHSYSRSAIVSVPQVFYRRYTGRFLIHECIVSISAYRKKVLPGVSVQIHYKSSTNPVR